MCWLHKGSTRLTTKYVLPASQTCTPCQSDLYSLPAEFPNDVCLPNLHYRVCHFSLIYKLFITPIYNGPKSNKPIAKSFLMVKFKFSILGPYLFFFKKHSMKIVFFGLCHSLLMDLHHNQQQHPAVHSWEAIRGRVPGCGCWR